MGINSIYFENLIWMFIIKPKSRDIPDNKKKKSSENQQIIPF